MISIKSICREEGGSKEKDGGSKKKLARSKVQTKKKPSRKKRLASKTFRGPAEEIALTTNEINTRYIYIIYILSYFFLA